MATDRVSKVTLGGYDQVIAVTQHMINNGIRNLFKYHAQKATNDDGSPGITKPFTVKVAGMGDIVTAIIDTPVVRVDWTPTKMSQMLYVMKFKSGTLNINMDEIGWEETTSVAPKPYDLAGWEVAIPVDLSTDSLKEGTAAYNEKIATQPPGQYSVTRLFVTVSGGASVMDLTQSKTPGADTSSEWGKEMLDKATQVFNKLLKALFQYTLHTVGYAVQSKNVQLLKKEHPATFQPTSLRLQTYPWKDPESDEALAPSFEGNARLNYLCYLEMTADLEGKPRPLPPFESRTLNWSGNWTDGRLDQGANAASPDFGNFAMSRKCFLEQYLIPKLRWINKSMEPRVKDLDNKLEWDTKWISFTYNWNADVRVGDNVDHPNTDTNYFDFKKSESEPQTYVFESKYNSGMPGCENMWNHKDLGLGVESWGQIGCECRNTLRWTPGKPVIEIEGYSSVRLYYSLKNITSDDDTIDYSVSWKMTLTLQAVDDGGLQIKVQTVEPVHTKKFTLDEGWLGSYGTYLTSAYETAVKNLAWYQAELGNGIGGQEKFYFPASGTFFFKDPMLNHEGALLCGIGYNGSDDFSNPETTEKRIIAQPVAVQPMPEQPNAVGGSGKPPKKEEEKTT